MDEVLDVVTRAYEYQRVRPAVVGTMSGLETVQLTLEGKLPTPPIIATLGISLVEAAEGRAVFEGSPAEWQYNQLATVHGGWLSALLDSAFGYAVQSALPAGRGFEQDLVISRALVEIYSKRDLSAALAFRGGTALHKLHMKPPARYSENPHAPTLVGSRETEVNTTSPAPKTFLQWGQSVRDQEIAQILPFIGLRDVRRFAC